MEILLHVRQLRGLRLEHRAHGDARPLRQHLPNVLRGNRVTHRVLYAQPLVLRIVLRLDRHQVCLDPRCPLVVLLRDRVFNLCIQVLDLATLPLQVIRQVELVHAHLARCLIHQVDCLVGQVALLEVPVGEGDRCLQRRIRDLQAVVLLIALAETAKDQQRIVGGRFVHVDGREPALQRGILLDVLAVLVQRGRADDVQFSARKGGFEHIGGIHRALGRPGADDGVQLVDEQDDAVRVPPDLLDERLQPLLELAAELGAREHRSQVEREYALLPQGFRHVIADDGLRKALDNGGLADARLTDEHGVILRAAGQYLHQAPGLDLPPDDRIELALAGQCRQVDGVLLQGVASDLRVPIGDLLVTAHLL